MAAQEATLDEPEDDFLSFHFNISDDDSNQMKIENEVSSPNIDHRKFGTSCAARNYSFELSDALKQLSQPLELTSADVESKMFIISNFMGNLSQCRLNNAIIQEHNGIQSLMRIVAILANKLTIEANRSIIENEQQLWKLTNITLGSLRDLACGNAANRLQIGSFTSSYDMTDGIDILTQFIKSFHQVSHNDWKTIAPLKLKVLTSALGVIRNITHSTPCNCRSLHNKGMTDCFIHLLLNASKTEKSTSKKMLPDASQPHREACYRLAGSLINMAEKCEDVAIRCSHNNALVWLLIESWGGTSEKLMNESKKKSGFPVLHLGLAAILYARLKSRDELDIDDDLTSVINFILAREGTRKKSAQEREKMRKIQALIKDVR